MADFAEKDKLIAPYPSWIDGADLVFRSDVSPEQTRITEDRVGEHGLIQRIIRFADGHATRERIIDQVLTGFDSTAIDWTVSEVDDAITFLIDQGVVLPSAELAKRFYSDTSRPPMFPRRRTTDEIARITADDTFEPIDGEVYTAPATPTEIGRIALYRESCRSFSDRPMRLNDLMAVLHNAYGLIPKKSAPERLHRPIASGGGLYASRLYVIIKEGGVSGLPGGMYQFDQQRNGQEVSIIKSPRELHPRELQFALNDHTTVHGAPVLLVIAADIDRHVVKYGNPGVDVAADEIGEIGQMVDMTLAELGANSLRFGGFDHKKMNDLLMLPKGTTTRRVIAIGYTDGRQHNDNEDHSIIQEISRLAEGTDIFTAIGSPPYAHNTTPLGFHHRGAGYKLMHFPESPVRWSGGTAISEKLAMLKAGVETLERYASGDVFVDLVAKATELDSGSWLDPGLVVPYTQEQTDMLGLKKFDENSQIEWVVGKTMSGAPIYVPVDMVFYPIPKSIISRDLFYKANSSGVAAHSTYEKAADAAINELIERDAFMRAWMTKTPPDIFDKSTLPAYWQKKIDYWLERGRSMEVLDMSQHDTNVAVVTSVSLDGSYPYFFMGAGTSGASFDTAMAKAFEETELGIVQKLYYMNRDGVPEPIAPDSVGEVEDHQKLYLHRSSSDKLQWLWSGNMVKFESDMSKGNSVDLPDPIIVELQSNTPAVRIVRALVPGLIPISFGYGSEHYSLLNLDSMALPVDVHPFP
jgi:ribosomal protein S12 methylthiotransferase accessory factor